MYCKSSFNKLYDYSIITDRTSKSFFLVGFHEIRTPVEQIIRSAIERSSRLTNIDSTRFVSIESYVHTDLKVSVL